MSLTATTSGLMDRLKSGDGSLEAVGSPKKSRGLLKSLATGVLLFAALGSNALANEDVSAGLNVQTSASVSVEAASSFVDALSVSETESKIGFAIDFNNDFLNNHHGFMKNMNGVVAGLYEANPEKRIELEKMVSDVNNLFSDDNIVLNFIEENAPELLEVIDPSAGVAFLKLKPDDIGKSLEEIKSFEKLSDQVSNAINGGGYKKAQSSFDFDKKSFESDMPRLTRTRGSDYQNNYLITPLHIDMTLGSLRTITHFVGDDFKKMLDNGDVTDESVNALVAEAYSMTDKDVLFLNTAVPHELGHAALYKHDRGPVVSERDGLTRKSADGEYLAETLAVHNAIRNGASENFLKYKKEMSSLMYGADLIMFTSSGHDAIGAMPKMLESLGYDRLKEMTPSEVKKYAEDYKESLTMGVLLVGNTLSPDHFAGHFLAKDTLQKEGVLPTLAKHIKNDSSKDALFMKEVIEISTEGVREGLFSDGKPLLGKYSIQNDEPEKYKANQQAVEGNAAIIESVMQRIVSERAENLDPKGDKVLDLGLQNKADEVREMINNAAIGESEAPSVASKNDKSVANNELNKNKHMALRRG